ncbi:MAG: hypothetical protein CL920_10670 [Deltaproteobacteria bacterium]|nr:hypothetical protein [Deltaproteobacteria bacterium]MBU49149.1 hypothetical protein [Deltaproteobacteria bacterium]|tara:strand:+ start:845 stop:2395 length:1551 start_codon:yes stop_codon:yes gene_type:complete
MYVLTIGPGEELPPDSGQLVDAETWDEPVTEEPVVEEPFEEEPACEEGQRRSCNTDKPGVCRPGEEICTDGKWGACQPFEQPSTEICDGLDNDCDGVVDESLVRKCPYSGPQGTEGVSHCRAGTQTCQDAQWAECKGESLPQEEVCNGKDDDCDGAIDEWLPIQTIGTVRVYSDKGDPSHLHMTASPSIGYAFGWSETGTQKVYVTRVRPDGSRLGTNWLVTPGNELGNIHGMSFTGKHYAVGYDTDNTGGGTNTGDAIVSLIDATGKRIAGPQLLAKGGRMVNTQISSGPGILGVVWSDFLKLRIYTQILDMNLKPISAPLSFPISTQVSPYPGSAFSGDRMGVIWIDRNNRLQFAVMDRKGKQLGQTQPITYNGSSPKDPSVTGDANGYLTVWSDSRTGKLWGLRLDRNGKAVGQPNEFASGNAETPLLKATSFGGVVAWIEQRPQQGLFRRGIAIGRIDKNGKLLGTPSWAALPTVEPYLALAWTDLGQGTGRGAIAWIERNSIIKVAPLGCR